jgi:hypothetical protein
MLWAWHAARKRKKNQFGANYFGRKASRGLVAFEKIILKMYLKYVVKRRLDRTRLRWKDYITWILDR